MRRTVSDAQVAHSLGIDVYVIGVTSVVNVTEVRLMSSPPQRFNQSYWLLPDFTSFDQIGLTLGESVCEGESTH